MIKNFISYCLLLVLSALLVSCQKEAGFVEDLEPVNNPPGNPPAGGIQGNWKFLYMDVDTKTTMEFEDNGVDIISEVTSTYRTINNIGVVVITADKFSYDDLSYGVAGTATEKTFMDGIKVSETQFPFDGQMPPLDNSVNYTLSGTDSVTFSGGLMQIPDANGSTSTQPVGEQKSEIKVNGNIMKLTSKYAVRRSAGTPDMPMVFGAEATSVVTLEKM